MPRTACWRASSPFLAKWEHTADLNDRALELGRVVDDTAYMLPYGFYLRAMFYNKKLLEEAGVEDPPNTLDEFRAAAEKVAKLPGKYGYCLRGGPGGLNGWVMFGATMAGDNAFFDDDGNSTLNSEGWVKGVDWVVDLYKNGLAPKDSVNWGFNEIVAGFYSGTCAMLDQDPDALIAIAERMKPEDFGVVPCPKGAGRQDLPDHRLCRLVDVRRQRAQGPGLEADRHAGGPRGQRRVEQAHRRAAVYKSAEKDPFYAARQFKGWFEELADPNVVPTVMPTYLEEFAFFEDAMVIAHQPAGAARRHHAGGARQRVGRLPDQGAAEVPRQVTIRGGRRLARLPPPCTGVSPWPSPQSPTLSGARRCGGSPTRSSPISTPARC